jgi:carbamoyltransferase
MTILGISCYYHDAAATLVVDGSVVAAAAEERFTRKKHDNDFPIHAIRFCLDWANVKPAEVDLVAFYEKPIIKFHRILYQHLEHFPKSHRVFVDTMGSWFSLKLKIPHLLKKHVGYNGKVVYVPHHLSHAAGAYYLSSFAKAAIVTIDGVGEWATTTMGVGTGPRIRIDREIHFPHSLGLLYSTLTAYLGFRVNDAEYKVMGLAAYGDPKPFRQHMNELVRVFDDGSYTLTMKYFDYTWADHMHGRLMEKLFGYPARPPESPMLPHYENIAASLQEKLEQVVFHVLCVAHRHYKTDALCLSGGVALNSVMNGKICSRTPFKNLYIPPDPGDGGGAMGAALYASAVLSKKRPDATSFFPSLGPGYTDAQIEDILCKHRLSYQCLDHPALLDRVSDILIQKKVIGWFQGRMEWGPRALGNRSILASASEEKMKDIINAKVKHREMFRPFAPVILDRYVRDHFKADRRLSRSANYMLMVYPFREKKKRDVPATVHVDGTGRLQVITRTDNPLYFDLIDSYRKKTGIPVVINTSFNVRGEPIVCTPEDAIQCFLKTGIDYLVIGSYLVSKSSRLLTMYG